MGDFKYWTSSVTEILVELRPTLYSEDLLLIVRNMSCELHWTTILNANAISLVN